MIFWLAMSLCWAQESVYSVYKTLEAAEYESSQLEMAAIQGMLSSVDEQRGLVGSRVLSQREYQQYLTWREGDREGYGMRIQILPGQGFIIEHIMKSSPAQRAGVKVGDLVVALNTRSLTGLTPEKVLELLEIEGGSRLLMDVVRDGERRQLKVVKGSFDIHQVVVEKTVEVQFFGRGTTQEIEKGINQSAVLDLRDNTGGLWEEAIETLDLFFPKHAVIAHRQLSDNLIVPILSQREEIFDGPLIVLVNQRTSGPAELVAITLQEHQRATIVGERSAGFAVDYTVLKPDDSWVLMLAETQLLSSKKQSWNQYGVVPNLRVSGDHSYLGEDRQLQTAIELIKARQ